MASIEEYSFDDYANFQNKENTPIFPVENPPDIEKSNVSHGAYTSVFELGNNRVAKISRILRMEEGKVKLQGTEGEKYLAEKTGDADLDRNTVINKMRELAREKQEIYELLGTYIGTFLPKIDMYAVVNSPRRELEKRMNRGNSDQEISNVPISEIALMEIWEKVDAKNALQNVGYRALSEMYDDPEFQQQSKHFADATLRLLEEKGVYIDISDRGGVRGYSIEGKRVNLRAYDELADGEQNGTLVYPRNTTLDSGKLKYFDTFPIHYLDSSVTQELLMQIKERLRVSDFEGLKNLESYCERPREFQLTTQYLYLLKRMGAEL